MAAKARRGLSLEWAMVIAMLATWALILSTRGCK